MTLTRLAHKGTSYHVRRASERSERAKESGASDEVAISPPDSGHHLNPTKTDFEEV